MSHSEVRDAAILAGGASRRMGRNKALLDFEGQPLIRRVAAILGSVFTNVVVVTSDAATSDAAGCPAIPDLRPGHGPLGGIHAALHHFERPTVCVACDMPRLNAGFLRYLAGRLGRADAVVPLHGDHLEPLHAVYAPTCLPVFEAELQREKTRSFAIVLDELNCVKISAAEAARFDPDLRMFHNWNTPADLP